MEWSGIDTNLRTITEVHEISHPLVFGELLYHIALVAIFDFIEVHDLFS